MVRLTAEQREWARSMRQSQSPKLQNKAADLSAEMGLALVEIRACYEDIGEDIVVSARTPTGKRDTIGMRYTQSLSKSDLFNIPTNDLTEALIALDDIIKKREVRRVGALWMWSI